jgi:serpin B
MYIINAVYFEGKWTTPFDKKLTYSGNFHLLGGSVKTVLMMKQHNDFNTYFGNTFVGVDLPYGSGGFSFTVLLPHENYDVESLIGSLNPEDWSKLINEFSKQEAYISIPKFKFEFEVDDLKEALTQLGMGICFDPGYADFTRINKDGGLYIDEAKHKTYIEVDEEGTKAAAVTSIGIGRVSLPPQIICDRPFLFIIREKKSESILFIGKVTDPVY